MEDPLYREIILEHWQNPLNYGTFKNADYIIEGNNPTCGDKITIYIKTKNGKITDIKFTSIGCAISKASASIFSEKIKNMSIKKIKAFSMDEVLKELPIEITPARHNCALLCFRTIKDKLH